MTFYIQQSRVLIRRCLLPNLSHNRSLVSENARLSCDKPTQKVLNRCIQRTLSSSSASFASKSDSIHSTFESTTCTTASGAVLDMDAVTDLFHQYAIDRDGVWSLNCDDIRSMLVGIGEDPKDCTVGKLFEVADLKRSGTIELHHFLEHAHTFLGGNPARIILVVGGPGSGKGVLSRRLETECNVVHLSSGDLLREEVVKGTTLGKQVRGIIARGELVSSAIMVALMKKKMRDHPGKRVLLDGFPRSLENAHDLVTLCGKPELALHLACDDTVLMERIMGRGASSSSENGGTDRREDDNFQTALQRLRTFHKYHHCTLDWLRENGVPIVNLDCEGDTESVWQQLVAMGRLMRPAVKVPCAKATLENASEARKQQEAGKASFIFPFLNESDDEAPVQRPDNDDDWNQNPGRPMAV